MGPKQKDKLDFTTLAFQIERGVKKNYSEDEIVEAVVKAVSPELNLRGYLVSTPNLHLKKLRRILRSHYQEPEATSLFTQLCSRSQGTDETPHQFGVGLMLLRQKVLFVAKEDGSRFNYTEELVQEQFIHSLLTGLRSDTIKNEVKPLVTGKTEDEDLLELLNKASSDEAERQLKI